MRMVMPKSVQEAILDLCKSGKGILELKDPATQALLGRLEFDEAGLSKTIEDKISVVGYIERLLTFSRKNVMIFFSGIPLDQLNKETKFLEHTDAG